jgi:hypothetical protein
MKTNIHFWSYLVQFFLEWEMFQTEVEDKIKRNILCSVTFFFRSSCRLWDNVEKYCRAGHATDDNMARAHCMLDIKSYKHTLRIRNTYCFTTVTTVTRTRLNARLYVHCLSCLFFEAIGKIFFELYLEDPSIKCLFLHDDNQTFT